MNAPWEVRIKHIQPDGAVASLGVIGGTRYLRADLTCGECAKQGVGFNGKGPMCNHAVSTDNRHLPPTGAPACMAFAPKEQK